MLVLVPKLRLGNPASEAPASCSGGNGKPELASPHSQTKAWERVQK